MTSPEPKVPKLVLKLPKKVNKKHTKHNKTGSGNVAYPSIVTQPEVVENRKRTESCDNSEPPVLQRQPPLLSPSKTHTPRDIIALAGLSDNSRNRMLVSYCDPCSVSMVDLIEFLRLSGNEHMIPAMPEPFVPAGDDDVTDSKNKQTTADVEPPVLKQAARPNNTPPTTAYEKSFMSFIDQKRTLGQPMKSQGRREQLEAGKGTTGKDDQIASPGASPVKSQAVVTRPLIGSPPKQAILTQGIVVQKTPGYRPILPKGVAQPQQTTMLLIPVTTQQPTGLSSTQTTPKQAFSSGTKGRASISISSSELLDKVFDNEELAGRHLIKAVRKNRTARKSIRRPTIPSQLSAPVQSSSAEQVALPTTSPSQRYRCLCCTYTCHNRTVMAEHIYNHTNIVPYSCGYCGSIFGTRSGVIVHHKRDHPDVERQIVKNSTMNEEQYYCSVSEYEKLTQQGQITPPLKAVERMSQHNTVPTQKPAQQASSAAAVKVGERADLSVQEAVGYKCRFCEFKTSDRTAIEHHVANTHQKDRRFVCPLCKVSFFKMLETMKKHIQKWHPGASVDNVQYEVGYTQVKEVITSDSTSVKTSSDQTSGNTAAAAGMVKAVAVPFIGSGPRRKPTARKSINNNKRKLEQLAMTASTQSTKRLRTATDDATDVTSEDLSSAGAVNLTSAEGQSEVTESASANNEKMQEIPDSQTPEKDQLGKNLKRFLSIWAHLDILCIARLHAGS